jgi:hypothetical protein
MGNPYQQNGNPATVTQQDPRQTRQYSGNETPSLIAAHKSLAATTWVWEFVAMVVSVAALLTTVALLAYMQDKPLSVWFSRISLNTVVSVLAVVSRSSLMFPVTTCISQLKWAYFEKPHSLYKMEVFDRASRGSWGSLRFLRHLPFEIASIGAVISVLAFVIGPFFQQLVNIRDRQVFTLSSNHTATGFGYAHAYDYPIQLIHGAIPNGKLSVKPELQDQS